jgi:DNA-binding IclR family transcriptional regulator
VTTGPRQSGDGTVAKALTVLDAVAEHGRPVRFTELLEDSPFPKATLYRFVQTLTAQGMLSYDPERQTYAPGLRLVRLAHAAWQASSLAPIARPYLDDLSRATGETVHLAQLDGGQVLYVDKRNAADPVEMYSQAGQGRSGLLHRRGQGDARLPARGGACPGPAAAGLAPVHAQDDHHRRGHARRTGRDPRARPCLRRRGTRARHHLHRGADPGAVGARAGRRFGDIDHDAHRSCRPDGAICRPSGARSPPSRARRRTGAFPIRRRNRTREGRERTCRVCN